MRKQELIDLLRKRFSEKIVLAFEKIRREDFVSAEYRKLAYENEPLPIGFEQTISQPYTIAFMLELLDLKDKMKILEVGSGSGYVLALINEISKNSGIFGIERIKKLCDNSRGFLKDYGNIEVIYGDGKEGLSKEAPFDRILVSASSESFPEKLFEQLKENGRIVCVVGNSIIVADKIKGKKKTKEHYGFSFVPLV